MGAVKKIDGRKLYIDMSEVIADDEKVARHDELRIMAHQENERKKRGFEKQDPFTNTAGTDPIVRKYKTPEELRVKVEEYFESCNGIVISSKGEVQYDEFGKPVWGQVNPYTVSGLARHLGLTTQNFLRYEEKGVAGIIDREYFEIIYSAKQRIEEYAEKSLYESSKAGGAKFVLEAKFDWESRAKRNEFELAKARLSLLQKELQMKENLLKSGVEDPDSNNIVVNIVRAERNNSEVC